MSREDDVGKALGKWLGKAKPIGEPPATSETTGMLKRPERVFDRGEEALSQLNFKITENRKRHIKQLAVRDNITLLTMLDRMVELYEREYGRLGSK